MRNNSVRKVLRGFYEAAEIRQVRLPFEQNKQVETPQKTFNVQKFRLRGVYFVQLPQPKVRPWLETPLFWSEMRRDIQLAPLALSRVKDWPNAPPPPAVLFCHLGAYQTQTIFLVSS